MGWLPTAESAVRPDIYASYNFGEFRPVRRRLNQYVVVFPKKPKLSRLAYRY